ncbi:opine oxidase subunit B [Azorhizobium caulinodans ORS 571]|uniref:Opine oxidase subunit B n=1 Tax=Azorhizobium caulinodans (strain ATCC 43989 / DSM 5975 / JCM 20966 / LMG 6465 / NBRC 14845 / NCIMB 13405 / ORS 571) TaxID=438753 RepID=A8I0B1_AZOC5|nr:FAD-dependent oxidoreductase [Azorhizobium caulinodans]BAF87233.1 opine oxidase subunit B [Azorhizobium caulinodans ORS 571]
MSAAANEFDVAVIGGGLVGASISYGLARGGARVAVLDEGDIALRASRGNFALVWVQSKGLGMPEYAAWTVRGAGLWPQLAQALKADTGLDVTLQQPGGFHLALSEAELEKRSNLLQRLHNQPRMMRYDYEILDHARVKEMMPEIGPQVVGASYCPLDGHVNSLRLFRALHTAMERAGARYFANHGVEAIAYEGGEFRIATARGEVRAAKVVLAAGNGNARLGPMVGLDVPVRPQRGQIVVTERTQPFMRYPVVTVRQTDEGTVMLGDSVEEAGPDPTVGLPIVSAIADRAVRMFPRLGGLNVVRTWAALRVMTKDGFPIYDQSATCPGAFVATCHSGVTLAATHAFVVAPAIAAGGLPREDFEVFSARRFHVPAAA